MKNSDILVLDDTGNLGSLWIYKNIVIGNRYKETDIHKFLKVAAELMGKEYKPFLGKDDAIWCPSEELAKQVLEIADKLGYQWANKEPFSKYTRWGLYRQGTCYYISEGFYGSRSAAISYGRNIIPAGNFINYYKKYLNMKKRNVQITLEQAREWYGSENQTLKTLALSAFKKEELELTLNEIFTRVKYSSISIPIVDNVLKVTILSYLAMLAKYFNEDKPIPATQFFIKGKDDNGEVLLASHTGVRYPGIIYFNHSEDLREAIKLIGDDIKYLFE